MNKTNKLNKQKKIIFLLGPTGSGKTELAIKLRKILPVELISVDSALIYKGMNIGTGKPSTEELQKNPHRLIDIIDPSQTYSAANFRLDALEEIKNIISLGKIPLLVGGTMFYFKALIDGLSDLPPPNLKIRNKIEKEAREHGINYLYRRLTEIDPVSAKRIHKNDLQRLSRALEVFFISGRTLSELTKEPRETLIPYRVYQFVIFPTKRKLLYQRIEKRFHRMLTLGFEEEVHTLFSRKDLHENMPSIRCVGYRQMWSFLKKKISFDEMVHQSIFATKQLIKHQITWLRSWNGIYHLLDNENPQESLQKISQIFTRR